MYNFISFKSPFFSYIYSQENAVAFLYIWEKDKLKWITF